MMHWWCTNDELMMHWWCADDALIMHRWYTDDALMMNWWGADEALVMCWWCTEDAQMMHCQCTDDALLMHGWCGDDALMMHCWCTADALMMHWWCASIIFDILESSSFQKYSICRVFCAVWWYDDHHMSIWWWCHLAGIISLQKIFGLYGLKPHIVEIGRQHFRLSICFHFCWAKIWWCDEGACLCLPHLLQQSLTSPWPFDEGRIFSTHDLLHLRFDDNLWYFRLGNIYRSSIETSLILFGELFWKKPLSLPMIIIPIITRVIISSDGIRWMGAKPHEVWSSRWGAPD